MTDSQMCDVASTSDTASVPPEEQQTLDLVQQLLRSFQNGQSGMVFACGGTVPIPVANNTAQEPSTTGDGAKTCQPVILRWDPNSTFVPAADCKLQFPLDHSDRKTVHNMQQLFHDMQPATFGDQAQNILNQFYRKVSKLDPSHFACSFSPHELGIVDEVARILLPGFKDHATSTEKIFYEPDTERVKPTKVMRAELYKLNVYAGPSGHFKVHVDTPQSTDQIGSLVICLPSAHQGGQLEVRHEGRTMTFDWSMPEAARPEIQWAAFYSDCEHDVLEVTSGHRITLTYNLYASSATSPQHVGNGVTDPAQLPLYGILHPLFLQENFMPDGGYLGVHTSHAYPHTSNSSRLPSTLKGADMVVWETFHSLGCGVRLRPVVELPGWAHYGHDYKEPCPAADLTDASSEGDRSHTDNEELRDPPSGPDHQETARDSTRYYSDSNNSVDTDERSVNDFDLPIREKSSSSARRSGHSVADARYRPTLEEKGDGDQIMGGVPRALPIGPERWKIDADEVLALWQEAQEYRSLPITELQGIEPAGLLVPRDADDKDERAILAQFEQIGDQSGCRVLGNGLSFHPVLGLLEGEAGMEQLLDDWIKQKPHRQERTAEQPNRVLYDEVAWLNHPGTSKEPQINYGFYGNEAEASIMYSTCSIIAEVPPFTTRKALLGKE